MDLELALKLVEIFIWPVTVYLIFKLVLENGKNRHNSRGRAEK